MSEAKKVDHWAFLATELGAAVPEPEIAFEESPLIEETPVVEEARQEITPPTVVEDHVEEVEVVDVKQVDEKPVVSEAQPARSERPRSSWDLLANELGIEVPLEPEPEQVTEPTAEAQVPTVERAVAERMFESLFIPQASGTKPEEIEFPAREERPATRREEPRSTPRREEPRSAPKREEPRREREEESSRRGGRNDKSRRGSRDREEQQPRSGKFEEPRRGPKSEPVELFLDEDIEAEEELEISFAPVDETPDSEEKKKRHRRRRGAKIASTSRSQSSLISRSSASRNHCRRMKMMMMMMMIYAMNSVSSTSLKMFCLDP
jgi:hypothetical protein